MKSWRMHKPGAKTETLFCKGSQALNRSQPSQFFISTSAVLYLNHRSFLLLGLARGSPRRVLTCLEPQRIYFRSFPKVCGFFCGWKIFVGLLGQRGQPVNIKNPLVRSDQGHPVRGEHSSTTTWCIRSMTTFINDNIFLPTTQFYQRQYSTHDCFFLSTTATILSTTTTHRRL